MCDACDAGIGDDPVQVRQWLDQQDAWYRDTIRRVGWAIQHVDADRSATAFAYTVGLAGFEHPEIVVFGLGPSRAATLLNYLGELVRSGAVLPDGAEVPVLAGAGVGPVRMFALPHPGAVILTANRVYARAPWESLPAVQAVYPDRRGAWPWEPHCSLRAGGQRWPGDLRLDA